MTNTLHIPRAPRPELSTILWRISWPFFLFCAVLAALLTLSWMLLLPRYTRIDVGGTLRSSTQIKQYKDTLTVQIATKEEERRQAVLAVHDAQYDYLKNDRRGKTSLDTLRKQLTDDAKEVAGKENVIVLNTFDYDAAAKTLKISGDVRNSETRSMTVLAQFAQSLKHLPGIASATTPTFAREEDPTDGPHSPFAITLTLK